VVGVGVVVVVVVVLVVVVGQQTDSGHSRLSSLSVTVVCVRGQEPGHSHSKIGQPSLSSPEHRSLQHLSHVGSGRGLHMTDLQPHSSTISTGISHGLQDATFIIGHCFSTHSYSAGQQHSVLDASLETFLIWHLVHFTVSSRLGHFRFSSVQHSQSTISWNGQHFSLSTVEMRYLPEGTDGGVAHFSTSTWMVLQLNGSHLIVTHGSL
jgi:hypothetical protein